MEASPATRQMAASAASEGPNAVADACSAAVASLTGDIGLLLAFTSGEMDHDRAAAALAEAAPSTPTAGLTGKGLITHGGPVDEGCVAMAFGSQLTASVGVARDASSDLRGAGASAAAAALEGVGEGADAILMFIDSSKGDIAETIAGAYEAAGPKIPLAGGAAGGDDKRHYQGGEATIDSVVAVALKADHPLGIAATQACKVRGTPAIVTRSEGQQVFEIDGRPAQEVYLEQLGFAGIELEEEFEALSITHPIAQPELHGDRRLRHVLGRDESGALTVGTHIPAGAAVEFTEIEPEELLSSGAGSVELACQRLGQAPPQAGLVFDCAGRRRALGTDLEHEVESIASAMGEGAPPLAGLYTYGEVARLKGAKGDRNHAVVTVAFA